MVRDEHGTSAHLNGVLPRMVLGQQLVSICMQLVNGLLLLLQLPVDEVLDGEKRAADLHANRRGHPKCSVSPLWFLFFLSLQMLLKMGFLPS